MLGPKCDSSLNLGAGGPSLKEKWSHPVEGQRAPQATIPLALVLGE